MEPLKTDPILIAFDFLNHEASTLLLFSEDRRCSISRWGNIIYVDPTMAGEKYPVYLQFTSTRRISGVGFAVCVDDLHCHSDQGYCGGCFYLDAAIAPPSSLPPLILDEGEDEKGVTEYHFILCFDDGRNTFKFDPQIYNQGIGECPAWRRWFQRWGWRLRTWRRRRPGRLNA